MATNLKGEKVETERKERARERVDACPSAGSLSDVLSIRSGARPGWNQTSSMAGTLVLELLPAFSPECTLTIS